MSVFHNFLLVFFRLFSYKLWTILLSYCFTTHYFSKKFNCFIICIFFRLSLFILFFLIVWFINRSKNALNSLIKILIISELFIVPSFYLARLRLFIYNKIQKFHYFRRVVVLFFLFELYSTFNYHIMLVVT